MPPFSNLVSDSVLIKDAISLLTLSGGRASAIRVVDRVMKIRKPDPAFAKMLVSDLMTAIRVCRLRTMMLSIPCAIATRFLY